MGIAINKESKRQKNATAFSCGGILRSHMQSSDSGLEIYACLKWQECEMLLISITHPIWEYLFCMIQTVQSLYVHEWHTAKSINIYRESVITQF